MKLTLRVKRMLPQIYAALDKGETEFDLRKRFSLSPRLFAQIKEKWEENNEEGK